MYNKEAYKRWFDKNGKNIRKKYNKEYSARPEVIKNAKIKNSKMESKILRKKYKQTEAGKRANKKYLAKPEVKLKIKKRRIVARYGLNLEDYEELYKKQKGNCAICDKYFDKLDIDHCHKTGKVRGLLCGSCNRALGLMKDNIEFLKSAISYLYDRRN